MLGLSNPLNAMQILFINILMDGPPSQSLGVDPVDPAVMRRPPRKKNAPIITKRLLARVLFSASIIVIGTLFIYVFALKDKDMSRREQTMVSPSLPFIASGPHFFFISSILYAQPSANELSLVYPLDFGQSSHDLGIENGSGVFPRILRGSVPFRTFAPVSHEMRGIGSPTCFFELRLFFGYFVFILSCLSTAFSFGFSFTRFSVRIYQSNT